MEKKVSIVIITYNRSEDLLELLNNISSLNNTAALLQDVIIVNNASTTDYSAIENFISRTPGIPFQYIISEENLGVARGRNFATQFAHGDILAFFDDDVIINDKDVLKKIIHSFGSPADDRELGIVSFKVLYDSTGEMQVNAFPHKKFKAYRDRKSFLTYYYTGCAHAFTREAWQKAGYYPDDFFYGMEEYDLSYRTLDAGYAIGYESSVLIRHKESPLGRQPKPEKLRMMWVNKTKVAWKYLPLPYFLTTSILWSLEYFKKAGFNLKEYRKGWSTIFHIPFTEKRRSLKISTRQYLRKVKARLLY